MKSLPTRNKMAIFTTVWDNSTSNARIQIDNLKIYYDIVTKDVAVDALVKIDTEHFKSPTPVTKGFCKKVGKIGLAINAPERIGADLYVAHLRVSILQPDFKLKSDREVIRLIDKLAELLGIPLVHVHECTSKVITREVKTEFYGWVPEIRWLTDSSFHRA